MESKIERAVALRQRLDALQKEQREIESDLYNLEKEVAPKARYGNLKITVDPEYKDFRSSVLVEGIRLQEFLLNEQEKKDHMKIFGSINGDWKESRGSVTYYRNEYGVLNHFGGGYILLQDGIPCNDDEWEAIKQGNIPDKFQNKRIQ